MTDTRLYTYWRSTAAYRVRIALNLKGIEYDSLPVHLVRDGGEQRKPGFIELNPQGLVPVLSDGAADISQSLAIIAYLDETHPEPPLLPPTPLERARVRSLATTIACDIHPICNLRVLQYLGGKFNVDDDQRNEWIHHWIRLGFVAIEKRLATDSATGTYCHGEQPGLADICLVPQVYNADRFECDMAPYPTIRRIVQACLDLDGFRGAAPENQIDAP
ncbi:MAG: maleylacetoacetate isomerase [Gammaproteobacteria bacterium]